jgi:hypothetical protein
MFGSTFEKGGKIKLIVKAYKLFCSTFTKVEQIK